jgi:chain length determinant protein (polysaccharide antigen chain regulator)
MTQNTSPVNLPDAHFRDDEINLFDLIADLNVQKRWVAIPLVTCVLLALVYVSIAKPVFQVKSVVKPAAEKELVELNPPQLKGGVSLIDGERVVRDGVFSMDRDQAYEHSKQALLSKEYRKAFYKQNIKAIKENRLYDEGLTFSQNFSSFSTLFKVQLSNDKKDAEKFIELRFELGNAELATQLLNDYVAFSLNSRLVDVKATFEHKLSQAIRKLEYDASLIRDKYYTDKARKGLEVSEALAIAKSAGISQSVHQKSGVIANTNTLPRYMFGSNALAAEKVALDSRAKLAKSLPFGEDHFIAGLPEKSFEIKKLKELKIDFEKVKLAKVDELASLPRSPIKPKKKLIVALSIVVGLFLGLMTALLVAAYKRYLKERED